MLLSATVSCLENSSSVRLSVSMNLGERIMSNVMDVNMLCIRRGIICSSRVMFVHQSCDVWASVV